MFQRIFERTTMTLTGLAIPTEFSTFLSMSAGPCSHGFWIAWHRFCGWSKISRGFLIKVALESVLVLVPSATWISRGGRGSGPSNVHICLGCEPTCILVHQFRGFRRWHRSFCYFSVRIGRFIPSSFSLRLHCLCNTLFFFPIGPRLIRRLGGIPGALARRELHLPDLAKPDGYKLIFVFLEKKGYKKDALDIRRLANRRYEAIARPSLRQRTWHTQML